MLYTLGTSNRSADSFFDALKARRTEVIVDVRAKPRSRFAWANKSAIETEARRLNLNYVWRGDVLGGWSKQDPDDPTVARVLDELVINCRAQPTTIFCSEGDPAQCHRTWFVAASLLVRHGIVAKSILRDDTEEGVTRTLLRLNAKMIPDAIRDEALAISRRAECLI